MAYPFIGKSIDKNELEKKVLDYIILLEQKVIAMQLIIPLLREFEGKKVSKHIETRAKALMTQFDVYYKMGVVNYELKIYGNGIPYDECITIWLTRIDGDKILNESKWNEHPNWFDYQGHIDKLQSFLNSIHYFVTEWNKMIDYLGDKSELFHSMSYPLNESFDMRKLFH